MNLSKRQPPQEGDGVTVKNIPAHLEMTGKVVLVIPAGEEPPHEKIAELIKQPSPTSSLRKLPVPRRKSVYPRILLEIRSGRVWTFTSDKFTRVIVH